MDWKRIVGQLAFCMLVFLVVNATLIYLHEHAHQQIFKEFGVNSTIEYGFLYQSGLTIPEGRYANVEDARVGNALQAQNEMFGYQITALELPLVLLCLLLMFCLERRV
jgi:hypothetical protein